MCVARRSMEFVEHLSPYLRLLHYSGISPYHPSHTLATSTTQFIKWAIIILHASISFGLAFICFNILINYDNFAEFSRTETIVGTLYLLCDMTRVYFLLWQWIANENLLNNIIKSFRHLELCFLNQLDYRVPYRVLAKRYKRILCLMTYLYVQYVIAFIYRSMCVPRLVSVNGMVKVMQGFTMLTFFHIIFYVEALSFHLEHLIAVIQRDTTVKIDVCGNIVYFRDNSLHSKLMLRSKLKFYKSIHFKLWTLCLKINKYFGWILSAALLQNYTAFIFAVYWFMGHFNMEWSWVKMIRKKYKC